MAETASPDDSSEANLGDAGDAAESKRKFREALQRKQTRAAGGGIQQGGGGAQSRAHGPAGNRREFRRRSGG